MITDTESESLLLASFLYFPVETGGKCVKAGLTSQAFTSSDNQALYRYLLGVWTEGRKIHQAAIALDLKKTGQLAEIGGVERLQYLAFLSPSQYVVDQVIETLLDLQQRRLILGVTKKAYEDIQTDRATPEIIADLDKVVADVDPGIEMPTPAELNAELLNRSGSSKLVRTGFSCIDKECGLLYGGDFLVIGGQAKAGKSILAGNIARNICRDKFTVVFTIEMNRTEYWKRIVDSIASTPSSTWDNTQTSIPAHMQRAAMAMKSLESAKITIIDRVQDIEQAFSVCRAIKAAKGELGCVVFDYIQQFSSSTKTQSRSEEVAAVSRACKRGAVALDALVIGVAQLNDDNKSLDSRGIQRDANLMLNITVEDDGAREIYCAYNRNGPMGMSLPLTPEFHYSRFIES